MGVERGATYRRFEGMFVRDNLALVARWAREQLRDGVDNADTRAQLRRLVDAADALRLSLGYEPEPLADNVIDMQEFKRHA
jgi:hypothetical protein